MQIYQLMTSRFLFAVFLLITPAAVNSQAVKNDSIKYARQLFPDAPSVASTSRNCTVEWDCVDKKTMIGQITLHNDQWFSFTTDTAGTYYLNITNQVCRDEHGLQVLIIDGQPCNPPTYKYRAIHSRLTLENFYYSIESLEARHTYLVSIDGLLGDFCDFNLGISHTPPDYALYAVKDVMAVHLLDGERVLLEWEIPHSIADSISDFTVLKKADNGKYQRAASFPLNLNAHGEPTMKYNLWDSLKTYGDFSYRITAQSPEGKNYLLKDVNFSYFPNNKFSEGNQFVYKSKFKGYKELTFKLQDLATGKMLKTLSFKNEKGREYAFDFSRQKNLGIKRIKIIVIYDYVTHEEILFTVP